MIWIWYTLKGILLLPITFLKGFVFFPILILGILQCLGANTDRLDEVPMGRIALRIQGFKV